MSAQPQPSSGRVHAHNALVRKYRSTVVMIPDVDWADVLTGRKTQFRSYSRRTKRDGGIPIKPTPAVGYHYVYDNLETQLIWLEDTWQEPLGSITAESIAAEGFASLDEFRRYFEVRYPKGGYRPLENVQVYRVRPITQADIEEFVPWLLKFLDYEI